MIEKQKTQTLIKKVVFLFILILYLDSVEAQSTTEGKITFGALPQYCSPQTASMLRFDQTSVDLFTGRVDISIPLVNFKDRDFDIPIHIRYNSAGFKPSESDNFVGNNWSLTSTFVIYREVKGIPDETKELTCIWGEKTFEKLKGFLDVRNMSINAKQYKENLWKYPDWYAPLWISGFARINTGGYNTLLKGEEYDYAGLGTLPTRKGTEVSSDIYRFSCGKYTGQFMIDFDGTVKVNTTSDGNVSVDISRYNTISNHSYPPELNYNEITLKTDDGYTYIFGGSYDSMEYMAIQWADSENPIQKYRSLTLMGNRNITFPVVNAYYLTKIIAPNGRILKIEYDTRVTPDYHGDPSRIVSLKANDNIKKAYQLNAILAETYDIPSWVRGGTIKPRSIDRVNKIFSVTKMAIMKSIVVDDKQVKFIYKDKKENILEKIKPSYSNFWGFNTTPLQLDSVVLFSGSSATANSIIDEAKLNYTDNGRLFLKSIKNYSGTYKFNYKNETVISPLSPNFDHWNYSTGFTNNIGLFPFYVYGGEGYEWPPWKSVDENNMRGPAKSGWDINMLNEIVYPTGGRTLFDYEQHTYIKSIERAAENLYKSSLIIHKQNKQAGGVRIKKIKYYDINNDLLRVKNYLYQNAISDTTSSGVLFYKPVYVGICEETKISIKDPNKIEHVYGIHYKSSLGYNPKNKEGTHIGYNTVIEFYSDTDNDNYIEMLKKSGYKQTYFTEKAYGAGVQTVSNPYLFSYSVNVNNVTKRFQIDENFGVSCFNEDFDFTQELGLVSKELYYGSQNKLIKQVAHTYSHFPELTNSTAYTLYVNNPRLELDGLINLSAQLYKVHLYKYRKTAKTVVDYTEGGDIRYLEEYVYTNDGVYLTSKKTTGSKGEINEQKYEYGFRNSRAPYIPSTITKEVLINNNVHNYSKYYNYRIKKNRLKTETYLMDSLQLLSDIRISYGKETTSQQQADIEILYNEHDNYGNPVCVIQKDGSPIVYLWSYYGNYMIAKIEGVTYDQIRNYPLLDANILAGRSIPDVKEYDAIYDLYKYFPNILITTYKYKQSVGLTKKIDPRGVVTCYEYDRWGRLKRSYLDNNGVKSDLKSYDYHYQNE